MVKRKFVKFEQEFLRKNKLSLKKKLKLMDGFYKAAVLFGLFPPKNPLEGIETDIKIARLVNRVPTLNQIDDL